MSVLAAAAGLLISRGGQHMWLGFAGGFVLCCLLTFGIVADWSGGGMDGAIAAAFWLASGLLWLPFFLVTYAGGALLIRKPKRVEKASLQERADEQEDALINERIR